jgi:[methyl-Co(III) methanol-specific corrinoid protein]:coenzyme M methyltransferase
MNSYQRVMAALRRQPVDRTPVINPTSVATVALMQQVRAPFPQANRRPELMAKLAATSYTELGFDSIMPVFTVVQESSALGCKIHWGETDNWPTVNPREPLWRDPDDIRIPADFLAHPDIQCVLRAIRILKQQYGNEAAVIGKTMGPWTLAYNCLGLENFLLMTVDDPPKAQACLAKLKEVTVQFGLAQIEAGADALTLPDHATGDLVSAAYYDQFLREIHGEFVRRLPVPLILHICGRTLDRMDSIARTGVAAFHFDSKNDARQSLQVVGSRTLLAGNLNNPQTLFAGSPGDVRAEVFRVLDAGVPLVAPECAIPLRTPVENLREIPRAVRAWHAERDASLRRRQGGS